MSPHPSHRAPGQVLPPTPGLSPRSADAPRSGPAGQTQGRAVGTGIAKDIDLLLPFFLAAALEPRSASRPPSPMGARPSATQPWTLARASAAPAPSRLNRGRRRRRRPPPQPWEEGHCQPQPRTRDQGLPPLCFNAPHGNFFVFSVPKIHKNSHPSEGVWHIIFGEPTPPGMRPAPKIFIRKSFPALGGYADSTPVPTFECAGGITSKGQGGKRKPRSNS